ncbi:hypothetical protein ACIGO9_30630 [Nocardia asteroides]|uniref:hypothetical protein n=1 Tax=Nocardia asteroides TaxID=1824 RepID=UPI0037C567AF
MLEIDAGPERWYELWWTHPSVRLRTERVQGSTVANKHRVEATTARITKLCDLPAPFVIPVEPGSAAVGVGSQQLSPGLGDSSTHDIQVGHRDAAGRESRPAEVEVYDWDGYVVRNAHQFDAAPPILTPGQLAAAALARLHRHRRDLDAARALAVELIADAESTGDLAALLNFNDVVATLDPELAAEPSVHETLTKLGPYRAPGKPRLEPGLTAVLPPELLAHVDSLADGAGLSREAWLRRAADSEARRTVQPS